MRCRNFSPEQPLVLSCGVAYSLAVPRATVGKWSRNDGPVAEYEAIAIAAALITDKDGRVLLVRKFRTLFFMQPGGKLGASETPIEALKRELIEELGCLVVKAEFLG
jgi:8-oxo-dGTP pyrophosphatase MutT (NUDIX family)